jgi:hypothetical protein
MRILEANPDKIFWSYLSRNPSEGAMRILEANPDKIDWNVLCLNTGVFKNPYNQYHYVLK